MLMQKNKAGKEDKGIHGLEAVLAILMRAVRKGLAEDVASESRPEGEGVFQTGGRANAKALWYQELKEDRRKQRHM